MNLQVLYAGAYCEPDGFPPGTDLKVCGIRAAAKMAAENRTLDIIVLCNQEACEAWLFEEYCSLLSLVLTAHPNKPHLVIEDETLIAQYYSFFNEQGIWTYCTSAIDVIRMWQSEKRRIFAA